MNKQLKTCICKDTCNARIDKCLNCMYKPRAVRQH